MFITQPATFPLPLEQARNAALHGGDLQERIVGIRSLRYYVSDATDDTQRRTNSAILDLFGDIIGEYRELFQAAVTDGESPDIAAEKVRKDPLIVAIGEVLRRILSRPALQGGCFDHEHVWRLDFLGLEGCNLPHAVLRGASLRHTVLSQSNFEYADLSGADLSGAELSGARLTHANLSDADLSGADLSGARLTHAELSDAELSGARLAWADLSHTQISRSFINQANLTGAVLDHAVMHYAFLSETEMTKTSLVEADLTGTNLFAANLSLARLQGSILTETGITMERIVTLAIAVQASPETRWGTETDRDGRNPIAPTYYTEAINARKREA